jgi:hypothetical protein
LVASGTVPGLVRIWADPEWELFRVQGSGGIVGGAGRLVSMSDSSVVVRSQSAGVVVVRERFNRDWALSTGTGCIDSSPAGWILVQAPGPEELRRTLSIGVAFSGSDRSQCPETAGKRASRDARPG